ncbi:MAG: hypothetical protein B7C24_13170 [Bacteroidetes bacterium 4572_77]|nr:MAG: hypothetical protein B7C24_13170 [Bacteroidetes bacterium 4572_77]
MRKILFLLLSLGLLSLLYSCTDFKNTPQFSDKEFTIVFYNVENLFDTIAIDGKMDEEFTPNSKKKWDSKKYHHKLKQLATVIDSIGGAYLPDVVALEEVENLAVLQDLVKQKSIAAADYQIIHYESPDFRGIDNALLYNPQSFKVLQQEAIPITMPDSIGTLGNHPITTRDILYVKGIVRENDTIHILVNHWTSMYFGEEETVPHRRYCAYVAQEKIAAIKDENPNAKIILGGDLNEDAFGPAMLAEIKPDTINYNNPKSDRMYNLAHYLYTVKAKGSYNYKGVWGILDHIIISGNLLNSNSSIYTTAHRIDVFDSPMVLNYYNNSYGKGNRPNRSYAGNNYYGGFSDHLPIYLTFTIQ